MSSLRFSGMDIFWLLDRLYYQPAEITFMYLGNLGEAIGKRGSWFYSIGGHTKKIIIDIIYFILGVWLSHLIKKILIGV